MQQLPRDDKSIKMMLMAQPEKEDILNIEDDCLEINLYDEVETQRGWVKAKDLRIGDILIDEDKYNLEIYGIDKEDSSLFIYFENQNDNNVEEA